MNEKEFTEFTDKCSRIVLEVRPIDKLTINLYCKKHNIDKKELLKANKDYNDYIKE